MSLVAMIAGRSLLGDTDSATRRPFKALPNPAVAFPLDVCHLAWRNVDFERSKAANAGFPSLSDTL